MSHGVGMSDCCLSGKLHSGTPKGRVERMAGLETYVTEPENGSKEKSIVFISDIFGWEFPNTRLLADNYAEAGFTVYVPDFFEGDALPIEFLQDAEPPLKVRENLSIIDKGVKTGKVATTLGPWLIRHREAVVKPLIDGFFREVGMTPGTNKIGAVGFCWGGRYAILMTHGDLVHAAVACHPSLVAVPGDFDDIKKPLALAVGDSDSLLDNDTVGKVKDLLEKKSDVPSEVRIYKDQVHGFALRSDWSSDKDREAMDESEKQGKAWLEKYLS